MTVWDRLDYFRPDNTTDQWGDSARMDDGLLLELDIFRHHLGVPIHVTSGFRNSPGSQHALGLAVDIVCPGIELLDFYLEAERFNFRGIGLYPHWKLDGKVIGGLHIDRRVKAPARWMGVLDSDGDQVYIGLDKANLRNYGVI